MVLHFKISVGLLGPVPILNIHCAGFAKEFMSFASGPGQMAVTHLWFLLLTGDGPQDFSGFLLAASFLMNHTS